MAKASRRALAGLLALSWAVSLGPISPATASAQTVPQQMAELRARLARRDHDDTAALARKLLSKLEVGNRCTSSDCVEARIALARTLLAAEMRVSEEAQATAEQALAEVQGLEHRDPVLLVRAHVVLADALTGTRDLAGARTLLEEAVAEGLASLGEDHPDTWNVFRALGDLEMADGRPDSARDFLERALAAAERVQGSSSRDAAVILATLASASRRSGDLAAARMYAERGLVACEQRFGPDHISVYNAHNTLSLILRDLGNLPDARRHMERSLKGFEKVLGSDHISVAGVLHNLGNLSRRLGDLDAAQVHLERALAIREQRLAAEYPDIAHSLNSLGLVAQDRGDLAKARILLERSLALRGKHLGESHPDLSVPLQNLAKVLDTLGEHDLATASLERALHLREQALGSEHPQVADLLHNLAILNTNVGNISRAREQADQSLRVLRAALGENHPRVASFLLTLARVQVRSDELPAAIENGLAAELMACRQYWLTAHHLSEREALAFAPTRTKGRDLALTLLPTASKRQRREAWSTVARGRGLAFSVAVFRRRAAAADPTAEVTAAVHDLVEARAAYARLLVRVSSSHSVRDAAQLEHARLRAEEAERALAETFPTLASHARLPVMAPAEAASLLPPGAALVSYVRYHAEFDGVAPATTRRTTRSPVARTPSPRYLAMILRHAEDTPRFVMLGEADTVEALVARWAAEAGRGPLLTGRTPRRTLAAYRDAGTALRLAVWDPVAAHLHGTRTVLIVPDGDLHMVSWYALPTGRDSFLVEDGPVIHLLAAEHDLSDLATTTGTGRGLLALGGASYDLGEVSGAAVPVDPTPAKPPAALRGVSAESGSLRGVHFQPVPGTRREAAAVAGMWEQTLDAGHGAGAVVLTDEAATEQAFTAAAPGTRILHLATHGFFTGPGRHGSSGPFRGVGGLAPAADHEPGGVVPPPLAGLAMAGANRRAVADDWDDGILTAEEVGSLDLRGVEWAVLSACDTGAGTIQAGEGVLGLQRAFRLAGVRTVVMSLWGVDDDAARTWMVTLYRARLIRGMSTADSVRAATRQTLAARRLREESIHPFYWAGFVAVGDWR